MSNNLKEGLKIAISGKSGCGNSSVSGLVAGELNLRLINYTFKDMALEHGVSFDEFCRMAEEDLSYDIELDNKQVELAEKGNCVLGSRLAIWVLKDADLKVYLEASLLTRAGRIMKREGGDIESQMTATRLRDARDHSRYERLYRIDNDDYRFADLVIPTDEYTQQEVARLIIRELRARFSG